MAAKVGDDDARHKAGAAYKEARKKVREKNDQKLIPPDLERCQVEKPNGYSFMTLGGVPALERCKNPPSVIIAENQPGKDGLKGSMSSCDGCLAIFRQKMGSAVKNY